MTSERRMPDPLRQVGSILRELPASLVARHPRVLFSRQRLAALRSQSRSRRGVWKELWARAEGLIRKRPSVCKHENEPDGGALDLAFAYRLWGDRRFLDRSLVLIQRLLSHENWVTHRGLSIDLTSSFATSSAALVYDLIYDDLTQPTRDMIVTELLKRDLGRFTDVVRNKSDWWVGSRMNWQSVICSNLGLAFIAMSDHLVGWREALRTAVSFVLEVLDQEGEDGAHREGLQYWHFGIGETAWFSRALRQFTKGRIDLFQHRFFRKTLSYALHMSTPDGCFDFGDCESFRPNDWLVSLLAREYDDRALGSRWQTFDHRLRPFRKLDCPGRAMRFALCGSPPRATRLSRSSPAARYFPSIATACMRSDWTEDGTFVAFRGGQAQAPHAHLDAGSFIIGANGERLVRDAGFWPYAPGFFHGERRWDFDATSSAGHSVLLVDGAGQNPMARRAGRMTSVDLGADSHALVCDLAAAYEGRLESYVRYFAFISPNLIFLLDDAVSSTSSYYTWQLQCGGRVRHGGTQMEIRAGKARLGLKFWGLEQRDKFRVASTTRVSHYKPSVAGTRARPIRSIGISPLHPGPSFRLAVLFAVGPEWDRVLQNCHTEISDRKVELRSDRPGIVLVSVNLARRAVSLPAREAGIGTRALP